MVARPEPRIPRRQPASLENPSAVRMVLASAAILIAAIPAVLTALAVWSALGRPLLFRQVRCGLGGRTFSIVKFRTMHDLRDAGGLLLPDRARETAVTRIIRRVRFDELPQLTAVLSGDLAFVGPRPLKPETIAAFGPLGVVRCTVLPGLTGWAQVNGNTQLSDREKLALDVWYVDHRSPGLDLKILLRTLNMLMFGERTDRPALIEAEAHLAARYSTEARQPGGARE
jgi:lipopolysaccharide/colanic/teichoic acid biosynthesis glycosyltransferase